MRVQIELGVSRVHDEAVQHRAALDVLLRILERIRIDLKKKTLKPT